MEGASVQRGLTTIGAGSSSECALAQPVITTNSFLLMSFKGAAAVNGVESQYLTRGSFLVTSKYTLLCFVRVSTTNSVDIAWELVSMSDGTTVQFGTSSTTSTSDTVLDQSISEVDLSRTFVYLTADGGSGTQTANLDEGSWTGTLTSPTNLRLQRGGSGTHGTIMWRVIQFAGIPTKLEITSVNSGISPQAGIGFPVVVQAQDANGVARNVVNATNVSLSLKTGTGTLGGTLTGTIAAGTNQVTISGVTYTKAESGVSITATRTSGDALTPGDSASFTVNPGVATTLAFTTHPANTVAGSNLTGPPTVAVQDNFGNTVTSSTASISVAIGTNPGGGILSGTTMKSTTGGVASFDDLTINKTGAGYTLTASSTGLTSATSSAFNISPGAASALAFTTQPGDVNIGAPISGPPTIAVQDAFGNTVTSSTASITAAIEDNPGGGTLSGTTSKNAVAGVASFNDLSINQPGNGYTLNASSTGLTSATTNTFNITATGSGGTITGIITRVSDGAAVPGALVEVFQGTVLMGSTTSSGTGSYSIVGLLDGVYTVQASSSGYVPQIREGVTIINGGTVTVDLALNVGIAIHSPIIATVINDFSVLVKGEFDTSVGEVGINVNGYVALQAGDEFAAIVPVDNTVTTLTATVTSPGGNVLASHTIPITVQTPSSEPLLLFRPSPAIALVSQPVSFTLTSLNPIAEVQLDGNGDGTIDFTGTTLQGQSVSFAEPGLYLPSVRVTEQGGAVRSATSLVQILDANQLDSSLQGNWTAMKNALRSGDIVTAVSYIVIKRRANYQAMFNALAVPLANIDQVLTDITFVKQQGIEAEYEMSVNEGGFQYSFMVLFAIDEDGVWRIKFF
jgi:hypothetical protein